LNQEKLEMQNADIASMIKIEQLDLFKNAIGTTYRDVSDIFDQFGVWKFIDDMYEFMHIQSDMVSFGEIKEYLSRNGYMIN
jgi:hypothetical protein